MNRRIRSAFVLVPCLAAAALAAPLVVHGLPDYESHLGEEYQPLKTLKFFDSRGREFHKWGPADNFLYAPTYGLSLLYWKLKGTFGPASKSFPYGFHQPLQQLTALILQSRILLLCFVLASMAVLGIIMVRAGFSRTAVFFALLLCAASNPVLIEQAVVLKGDGPMMAFSCLGLGAYVLIVLSGATTGRVFWLATSVAWAVSAKELALPLFALPFLGLVVQPFRRAHPPELRARWRLLLWIGLAAFVGWYLLLNVVYAPATWVERLRFWTVGPGKDPEIWGASNRNAFIYAMEILISVINNLGPGGTVAAVAAIATLLWLRPKGAGALALPSASFFLLGLLPAGYVPERFAMPITIALLPLVACAIDSVRQRLAAWSRGLTVAATVVAAANLLYANIVWLQLRSSPAELIEDYVRSHLTQRDEFSIFSFWPRIAGKSRLEALGYRLDLRGAGELLRPRADLPPTLFISDTILPWIDDFNRRPKRAALIKKESGFDVQDWKGPEALGYRLVDRLSSPLPSWYLFAWLPYPASAQTRTVLVYHLLN